MELLLGSGTYYNFLANKINANYPGELIQISPQYEGPIFECCLSTWYEFKDEVDEAKLLLQYLPEIKEKVFTHVYFCIPNMDVKHSGLGLSYDFIDLLKEHVLSYIYLLNNVVTYKLKVLIFSELKSEEFEVQLLQQSIRPLVTTAIQGTSSQLIYHTPTTLKLMTLEEWWASQWNWRVQ